MCSRAAERRSQFLRLVSVDGIPLCRRLASFQSDAKSTLAKRSRGDRRGSASPRDSPGHNLYVNTVVTSVYARVETVPSKEVVLIRDAHPTEAQNSSVSRESNGKVKGTLRYRCIFAIYRLLIIWIISSETLLCPRVY